MLSTYRVFVFAESFSNAFQTPELSYLASFYTRIPGYLNAILSSPRLTLLIPPKAAFDALGPITDAELVEILDYHTMINGFLGYTPTLQDGKTYRTKSGGVFVVSRRGRDVFINDAKIVKKNYILSNGVAQLLDKVI